MNIEARQGDIAEIAPEIAEAVALWIRNGYTNSAATWAFTIRPEWHPGPEWHAIFAAVERPWHLPEDSLLRLTVPNSNLKYAYIFSLSKNKGYVREQRNAIWRCLDLLSIRGVRKVAFIHMPFSRGAYAHEEIVRSDVAMLRALREWATCNAHSSITHVYLVDYTDEFLQLLQNEAQ